MEHQAVERIFVLTRACIACNGTIVNDTEMGEVIQLQGDQRKDVQEFLVDKKEGLELDAKTIKVPFQHADYLDSQAHTSRRFMDSRFYQQRPTWQSSPVDRWKFIQQI